MTKKLRGIVVIILALTLTLLWACLRSISKVTHLPTPGASIEIPERARSPYPLFAAPPIGPYLGLSDPRWNWYWESRKLDGSFEYKMPIVFYGRIADDSMLPVEGAKIRFQWTDLSKNGTSEAFTQSDVSGQFSLNGVRGKSLGVYISKQGYYAGTGSEGYFDYALFSEKDYYQPNRNSPVLFHLKRKTKGEAIFTRHIWTTIPADGSPVRFDFLNEGIQSAKGQLEIAAVTNTEEYPPGIFDWRAKISIIGGGMIEHNQEFPFEAPELGYQANVEFNMPSNASDWKRDIDKKYFIRFGNPAKYGTIHVELDGASQHIAVDYWINPNGSRNLEPDTGKGISNH